MLFRSPAVDVEHELLGMPLTTLCLGLAQHWKLPNWIIEGYSLLSDNPQMLVKALHIARKIEQPLLQQQKLDQLPALNSWLNRPANTLVFSCGLVMAAHSSWGTEQCIRWQRLISLYLKDDLATVQQTTHQLAVSHARRQSNHDLWHPAQALLWPWHTQRLRQPSTSADRYAPSNEDLKQWRIHCTELVRTPCAFSNPVQLIERISLALQACGLQRICIMTLDQQAQYAKVSHVHGINAKELPSTFALGTTPAIKHFMTQPTHLLIDDSNAPRINPQLPAELISIFADTHWVLASLSNGNRVAMLIAADQFTTALHPVTIQGLKKTLEYIQRALVLFSSRKR